MQNVAERKEWASWVAGIQSSIREDVSGDKYLDYFKEILRDIDKQLEIIQNKINITGGLRSKDLAPLEKLDPPKLLLELLPSLQSAKVKMRIKGLDSRMIANQIAYFRMLALKYEYNKVMFGSEKTRLSDTFYMNRVLNLYGTSAENSQNSNYIIAMIMLSFYDDKNQSEQALGNAISYLSAATPFAKPVEAKSQKENLFATLHNATESFKSRTNLFKESAENYLDAIMNPLDATKPSATILLSAGRKELVDVFANIFRCETSLKKNVKITVDQRTMEKIQPLFHELREIIRNIQYTTDINLLNTQLNELKNIYQQLNTEVSQSISKYNAVLPRTKSSPQSKIGSMQSDENGFLNDLFNLQKNLNYIGKNIEKLAPKLSSKVMKIYRFMLNKRLAYAFLNKQEQEVIYLLSKGASAEQKCIQLDKEGRVSIDTYMKERLEKGLSDERLEELYLLIQEAQKKPEQQAEVQTSVTEQQPKPEQQAEVQTSVTKQQPKSEQQAEVQTSVTKRQPKSEQKAKVQETSRSGRAYFDNAAGDPRLPRNIGGSLAGNVERVFHSSYGSFFTPGFPRSPGGSLEAVVNNSYFAEPAQPEGTDENSSSRGIGIGKYPGSTSSGQ